MRYGVTVMLTDKAIGIVELAQAVEERGLFPAMAGEFGAHVASLADDHRRIERVLGDLAAGDPADGWPLQAAMLRFL